MRTREHHLATERFFPAVRAEVFAYFADAANLQRITPPELGFTILSPLPIAMAPGAVIDYRLRLMGVPFRWRTLITEWEPGVRFVDEQVRGPYAAWRHEHSFKDAPGGTIVTDAVTWRLPFHPIGDIVAPIVRRQLDRIFRYRGERLAEHFAG